MLLEPFIRLKGTATDEGAISCNIATASGPTEEKLRWHLKLAHEHFERVLTLVASAQNSQTYVDSHGSKCLSLRRSTSGGTVKRSRALILGIHLQIDETVYQDEYNP